MKSAESSSIPIIDFTTFLRESEDAGECSRLVAAFETHGAVMVKDPRVSIADNDRFLDMMERYFDQNEDRKLVDARPNLKYQVGYTPPFLERPRDHLERVRAIASEQRPAIPSGADAKGRYYWRVGTPPKQTQFPILNAENVVPTGFPEWSSVMDHWGTSMLNAAVTVAEMLALGFGVDRDTFTRRMKDAPHLLDPTGTDMLAHGRLGAICAGFHYDLNFLSVHGKPRYPGLDIWTRDERRVPADLPDGYLLVQAGRQLEYLTGGRLLNGFHQVVVNERTLEAIEEARRLGRPIWRISSTFFAHIASDEVLEPIVGTNDKDVADRYPRIFAGHLVEEELEAIGLAG